MTDDDHSGLGGPPRPGGADAAQRQQRLGTHIVRLFMFLVGLVVIGRLNILTGGIEALFVALSIFAVLGGVPLLIGMVIVYLYRRWQLGSGDAATSGSDL